MVLLRTDRLFLRTHAPADEARFVQIHTDPEVRRYVGGRAWSVDEATTRFRAQYLGRPRATYGLWAAVLQAEDTYIGMCGLSGSAAAAHLGYYIARPYWRLGLASEAARALVDLGFTRLNLRRILADADQGNIASERILDKIGFRIRRVETLASGRVINHYELRR
jgi:[ribosomal protein S5]-alanine N-acetyltransferase